MMKIFSLSSLLLLLIVMYLSNAIWVFYELWHPHTCQVASFCLQPIIHQTPGSNWSIKAYVTPDESFSPATANRVWTWKHVNFFEDTFKTVNITLPSKTLKNGSLYFHLFLYPSGKSAFNNPLSVQASVAVTDYAVPVTYMQLLKNSSEETNKHLATTHWKPKITFHVLSDQIIFDRRNVPSELYNLLRLTSDGNYLPILYIDQLSQLTTDLKPIPKNTTTMELKVEYQPISVGKLRLWLTLSHSMQAMKSLGFSNKDLDDIKGIFTGTSLTLLLLTFVVSFFHIIFDFLAFKNDIMYWKKRETMAGLSIHSILFRCVSTIIIFLYLHDQQTSLLVLVPAGIGSVIELWKVKKALKVSFERQGLRLRIQMGSRSDSEKATENFDGQAIKYLSYVLYPLCIGAAFYSLFYVPHKSWYSWVIESLVNGVYAFGFLFMLPQLFINYKLKSVAHLPWRAFMYKAFNTFIDDVFAFIVRMPTSHRLACFRDDIVFFCYLYQLCCSFVVTRRLYPVDKSRPNEFGVSYEDEAKKED